MPDQSRPSRFREQLTRFLVGSASSCRGFRGFLCFYLVLCAVAGVPMSLMMLFPYVRATVFHDTRPSSGPNELFALTASLSAWPIVVGYARRRAWVGPAGAAWFGGVAAVSLVGSVAHGTSMLGCQVPIAAIPMLAFLVPWLARRLTGIEAMEWEPPPATESNGVFNRWARRFGRWLVRQYEPVRCLSRPLLLACLLAAPSLALAAHDGCRADQVWHAMALSASGRAPWSVEDYADSRGLLVHTSPAGWSVPGEWVLWRSGERVERYPAPPVAQAPPAPIQAQYMVFVRGIYGQLPAVFVYADPTGSVAIASASAYGRDWFASALRWMLSSALLGLLVGVVWERSFVTSPRGYSG